MTVLPRSDWFHFGGVGGDVGEDRDGNDCYKGCDTVRNNTNLWFEFQQHQSSVHHQQAPWLRPASPGTIQKLEDTS